MKKSTIESLSWKDLKEIVDTTSDMSFEDEMLKLYFRRSQKAYYTKVLNRLMEKTK